MQIGAEKFGYDESNVSNMGPTPPLWWEYLVERVYNMAITICQYATCDCIHTAGSGPSDLLDCLGHQVF